MNRERTGPVTDTADTTDSTDSEDNRDSGAGSEAGEAAGEANGEEPRFVYQDVVERVRRRLDARASARLSLSGFRPAAVAVILLDVGGQAHVILTKRSPRLRKHSGQVSLPGGVCDADDISVAHTAARETHEEIGLDPACIEFLGQLDDQPTPSGFIITPVVATLLGRDHERLVYTPNHDEVAGVFEAPLAVFADPERAESRGERRVGDLCYPLRAYRYREYEITGATAHILELVSGLAMGR